MVDQEKKVFVVIVTFNGLRWVDKCFLSLKNSSVSTTTIVIDNGSSDDTLKHIAVHYPEVLIITSEKNVGFGKANNIGIKKAYEDGADYVFLLNQDAWVEKDTIETLIKAQQNEPEYGVVSPMHINGSGNALDYGFSLYIAPQNAANLYSDMYFNKVRDAIYEVPFVNAAAWLISRQCVEKIGGFSPAFYHYGEDVNYLHRVKFHHLKAGVYPKAQIFHDREKREITEHFSDKEKVYIRDKTIFYSNPLNNKDIYLEIRTLKKMAMRMAIKLNFNSYQYYNNQFKVLSKIAQIINESKKLSTKEGLTFLQ